MSPAAPARKLALVLIQERLAQGPLAEIDFYRFEKMAKKELDSTRSRPSGLSALGVLACLRGDERKMRDCHERAIAITGGSLTETYNYATSLNCLRKHEEALGLAEKVYKEDPLSLEALGLIIRALYHLGRLEEAFARIREWDSKSKKEHPYALDILEEIADEKDIPSAREELARGETIPWETLKAELGL